MSGSLCLIHPPIFHQILPTTFNSIHLPSVTASKSVLLLYNTAPYVDGELLSTIQIHLATPAVRLRTLTWLPYLEPVPFMDFVFLLTLWMPDSLQKAMWIIEYCFFFPFSNNAGYRITIYNSLFHVSVVLPSPAPLSQVMETKNMLYLVTEYAKNGEIFGEWSLCLLNAALHPRCTSCTKLPYGTRNLFGKQGRIKAFSNWHCCLNKLAWISKVTWPMDRREQ